MAHVFADGSYGSSWASGPVATHTADGTRLDIADQPVHSYTEVVGWRAICTDPGDYSGAEHWHGPLWTRAATLDEQDLDARRIDCGDEILDEDSEDLICVDWEIHVGPSAELYAVELAAEEVGDAQRKLNEAVRGARNAGASWTDIGRAVGISRQSAHERWAKMLAE